MKTEHLLIGGAIILGVIWITKGKVTESIGKSVGAAAYNLPSGIVKGVYQEFYEDAISPLEKEWVATYKKTGVMPKFYSFI
jgi:hypothetical protein